MPEKNPLTELSNKRMTRRKFIGGAASASLAMLFASRAVRGAEAAARGEVPNLRPDPFSLPAVKGSRPAPTGTLYYYSPEAFAGGWDPTQHMVQANFRSEWNAFDRLFDLDPVTGEFIPKLGLTYEVVTEGLKLTLRPDVKFHNGQTFTAKDVKYTLERYTNPENTTADYFPGQVTVDIIDDHTCVVNTATPLPVLNLLTLVHVFCNEDSPEKLAEGYNGTGPFKFVKYEGDKETVTCEAFEDYWMGPPRLKTLVMTYVGDPSTRLAALQKGEVDAIDRIPGDQVSVIEGDKNLKLVTSQGTEITYLNFKLKKSEFTANKLIRQAFAHCVDRVGITESIMSGYATIPDSLITNTVWPFGAPAGDALPGYDLAAARAKLEEAGFPNGEGLPEFNVIGVVGFYANMKEYMEYVAANCKQVGINIKLEIKEAAAWLDSYFGGALDCDAIFIGWANMSPEPDEFFLPFFKSGSPITFIEDPEVDALLEKESKSTSLEDRAKIIREQIIPKLAEMCIDIPLTATVNLDAIRDTVKNFSVLPNTCWELWDVYKEEKV